MAFCGHLRKRRSLIEQYVDLDPTLQGSDIAKKTLLSITREKPSGRRVLRPDDGGPDECQYPPVKKPRMEHPRADGPGTRQFESKEGLYEDEGTGDEGVESGVDPGDSLCIFCDDGGYLLCCDGPCMRSFHPRRLDGANSKCATLGFPDEVDMEVRDSVVQQALMIQANEWNSLHGDRVPSKHLGCAECQEGMVLHELQDQEAPMLRL